MPQKRNPISCEYIIAQARGVQALVPQLRALPGAELELLLGMPADALLAIAREAELPVRFYVAFGHPSLSYSLSSVLRRPRLAASLASGVLFGAANQRRRLAAASHR